MKRFAWNDEKNRRLQAERNVSFEQVVFHIGKGRLLDIVAHHNPAKYPEQRIFIVDINNYAYLTSYGDGVDSLLSASKFRFGLH